MLDFAEVIDSPEAGTPEAPNVKFGVECRNYEVATAVNA